MGLHEKADRSHLRCLFVSCLLFQLIFLQVRLPFIIASCVGVYYRLFWGPVAMVFNALLFSIAVVFHLFMLFKV